jgi:hypothetical protein
MMIKKIISTVLVLALTSVSLFAQKKKEKEKEKDEEKKGFQKENLFTGGTVNVSFYNGGSILGASPIIGYKLAKWVDAGAVINFTYASQRDVQEVDDKVKQMVYGGGLFTRIYPLKFLFLQGQFEHNFTSLKYRPFTNQYLPYNNTVDANSLLVGAGYTQGRQPGSNTFYYVALLFDVIKDLNSPYVEKVYNPVTGKYSARAIPIIRAGFNIGLFEGRNNRR